MVENKFTAMMHAYALGCLNPLDYSKLLNLIERGEEYPYQDLGEFQNLVALLPSILEYDTPPKSVKENIARRLYYIKDEAKEKKEKSIAASEAIAEWSDSGSEILEIPDIALLEEVDSPVAKIETSSPEINKGQEHGIEEYVSEAPPENIIEESTEIEIEPAIPPIQETKPVEEEAAVLPEPVEAAADIPEPAAEEIKIEETTEEAVEEIPIPELTEAGPPPIAKPETQAIHAEEEIQAEEEVPEKEIKRAAPEKKTEDKKDEPKPVRSLGDFLAGAEIKPEDITGKIEFEDYFAEARKAEIKKRQTARQKAPVPVNEGMPVPKEKPLRAEPVKNYNEGTNYRRSGSAAGKIFSVLLVLVTAAIMYFYFNSELEKFKTDNERMTGEIQSLKDITTTDKDFLNILSQKDSRFFNLYGGSLNSYSYGKVIYSAVQNRGFIYAASLPELKENASYQFWVNIGGRTYMVHKFTAGANEGFFPFSLQRVNLNQPMRIFLTEEPSTGSQSPSRTVLLSGSN